MQRKPENREISRKGAGAYSEGNVVYLVAENQIARPVSKSAEAVQDVEGLWNTALYSDGNWME